MSNEKKMPNLKTDLPQGVTKFSPYSEENDNAEDIDSVLKEELAKQGLAYKFIDFKQARLNGGRSRNGWVIYRRQSEDPRLNGIQALADPDGLVRQGSLVLAVKTTAAAEKQKARVAAQNRVLKKYTENTAQELNGKAKALGGSSRIIAGYDKNS